MLFQNTTMSLNLITGFLSTALGSVILNPVQRKTLSKWSEGFLWIILEKLIIFWFMKVAYLMALE